MPKPKSERKPIPKQGLAIKIRRLEVGKTQEDIVAESQDLLTQSWVTDVERGRIDLQNAGFLKVSTLAEILNWTVYDLQEATGVDLKVGPFASNVEDVPVGVRVRIFPLSEASKPAAEWREIPDRFVKMLPEEHNPNLKIFFQGEDPDTNGTLYYILTNEKDLHIGQYYLIVHNETALVCEYKPFSNQGIFVHNGAFISPQEAQVIGLCHQQICKRTPTPPQN